MQILKWCCLITLSNNTINLESLERHLNLKNEYLTNAIKTKPRLNGYLSAIKWVQFTEVLKIISVVFGSYCVQYLPEDFFVSLPRYWNTHDILKTQLQKYDLIA